MVSETFFAPFGSGWKIHLSSFIWLETINGPAMRQLVGLIIRITTCCQLMVFAWDNAC